MLRLSLVALLALAACTGEPVELVHGRTVGAPSTGKAIRAEQFHPSTSYPGCGFLPRYESAWLGAGGHGVGCFTWAAEIAVGCFQRQGAHVQAATYRLPLDMEVAFVLALPGPICRLAVLGERGEGREIEVVDLDWPESTEGAHGREFVDTFTAWRRMRFVPPAGHPLAHTAKLVAGPSDGPPTVLAILEGETEPSYAIDLLRNVAHPLE